MLDNRHHEDDDLPLSGRDLSLDGKRDLRLGSVSSQTSVDSGMTKLVSTPTIRHSPPDADEDSDCDSDASGEYEPLRASSSRLSTRSVSPPPPLPPPRSRCNSLHAPRPSASPTSTAAGHFSEPPLASRSLGDLNSSPAEPAPTATRTNLSRFLGMRRSVSARRFALLWRRKSQRTIRDEKAFEDSSVLLNNSLPNLRSGTPAAAGAGATATVVPERSSFSLASTPRSASPGPNRVSPGALHRALKRVHERTLRRSRRGRKEQTCDNLLDVTCDNESAYFQYPGYDLAEERHGKSLSDTIEVISPVYELIVEPPSIVINCPEETQECITGQDRPGHNCSDHQTPGEKDDGYMTMDAMQTILRSPPSSLLHVPDADHVTPDPVTSDNDPVTREHEPCYLDMAGMCRLRRTFAASLTSSQAKSAPPARPPRRVRDEKFVSASDTSASKTHYANLSELHNALQALQRTGGPAITEDE